jgi:hypothetical protein
LDCSWTKIVRFAGWEFARPDSSLVLAFVYAATVSLQVEESCAGINPDLSLNDLEQVLTRAPAWIDKRLDWLKTDWPRQEIKHRGDLELYALTASKALLAAGSQIPDGTADEMAHAVALLFPQLIKESRSHEESYEAWNTHVTIETNGHMGWGYTGVLAREGRSLPIPDEELGGRSAFEVFLQNQMRIDIQRRIEAGA